MQRSGLVAAFVGFKVLRIKRVNILVTVTRLHMTPSWHDDTTDLKRPYCSRSLLQIPQFPLIAGTKVSQAVLLEWVFSRGYPCNRDSTTPHDPNEHEVHQNRWSHPSQEGPQFLADNQWVEDSSSRADVLPLQLVVFLVVQLLRVVLREVPLATLAGVLSVATGSCCPRA